MTVRRSKAPAPAPVVRGRGRPPKDAPPAVDLVKLTLRLEARQVDILRDIARERGYYMPDGSENLAAAGRHAIDACGWGGS